jgi:protein TonB
MAASPQPQQSTVQEQQAVAALPRQADPGAQDSIQAYLAQVFAALEQQKYYPVSARRRGVSGRVVLQFIILPDGQVVEPHITEPQGPSPFAEAALTALRRASPLPAFPSTLRQARLRVEVPMIYNLTGKK